MLVTEGKKCGPTEGECAEGLHCRFLSGNDDGTCKKGDQGEKKEKHIICEFLVAGVGLHQNFLMRLLSMQRYWLQFDRFLDVSFQNPKSTITAFTCFLGVSIC